MPTPKDYKQLKAHENSVEAIRSVRDAFGITTSATLERMIVLALDSTEGSELETLADELNVEYEEGYDPYQVRERIKNKLEISGS